MALPPGAARSEPIHVALLAPPGTGKTHGILLTCRYFKEVLGWTAGIEYQCVASQNRMSGRIDGLTMHSWGEVPIDPDMQNARERKKSKTSGGSQMYNKCCQLRWLLVDEISTAALYVTGVMGKNMTKAKTGEEYALDAAGGHAPGEA